MNQQPEKLLERRPVQVAAGVALVILGGVVLHALIPESSIAHHHHPIASDVLINQPAGERVVFRTVPKPNKEGRTVIDVYLSPGGAVPVAHVHPNTEEIFRVVRGTVHLSVDGDEIVGRAGDSIRVHPGQSHGLWNASDSPAHVQVVMKPTKGLNLALAQVHGFLNETGHQGGIHEFLQMARFAERYQVYRAGVPVWFQQLGIGIIAPWARLMGFRSFYERYSIDARHRNTAKEE